MVPLRAFAEALGAHAVHWDGESAIVARGNQILRMRPGDPVALLNQQELALPEPAYLVGGRMIVPRAATYRVIWRILQEDHLYTWLYFHNRSIGIHERAQPLQDEIIDLLHSWW